MDFIYKFDLYQDDRFNDQSLFDLVSEINKAEINKKSQSLLKNGFQSSGNIFLQNSLKITILRQIVQDCIESYYQKFEKEQILLIKKWPKEYQLIGWGNNYAE